MRRFFCPNLQWKDNCTTASWISASSTKCSHVKSSWSSFHSCLWQSRTVHGHGRDGPELEDLGRPQHLPVFGRLQAAWINWSFEPTGWSSILGGWCCSEKNCDQEWTCFGNPNSIFQLKLKFFSRRWQLCYRPKFSIRRPFLSLEKCLVAMPEMTLS